MIRCSPLIVGTAQVLTMDNEKHGFYTRNGLANSARECHLCDLLARSVGEWYDAPNDRDICYREPDTSSISRLVDHYGSQGQKSLQVNISRQVELGKSVKTTIELAVGVADIEGRAIEIYQSRLPLITDGSF